MGNNILVPTDFSDVCTYALGHAVNIARANGFILNVIHVADKDSNETGLNTARLKLEAIKESYMLNEGMEIRTHLLEGSIFVEIPKMEKEVRARMTVMGTHGKKGLQNLTGAYILKILERIHSPGLICQEKVTHPSWEKIIIPIFPGITIETILKQLSHFASLKDQQIHLFTIKESSAAFNQELENIIASFHSHYKDIKKTSVITSKAPAEGSFAMQLMDYAISQRADLIVYYNNTREKQQVFLLGPWDEVLLFNKARIPVLSVKPNQFLSTK